MKKARANRQKNEARRQRAAELQKPVPLDEQLRRADQRQQEHRDWYPDANRHKTVDAFGRATYHYWYAWPVRT